MKKYIFIFSKTDLINISGAGQGAQVSVNPNDEETEILITTKVRAKRVFSALGIPVNKIEEHQDEEEINE